MTRRHAAIPVSLPDAIAALVRGYGWTAATDGESGGAVFQLEAAGRPALYLKHGSDGVADEIAAERARLAWLEDRLPVPRVVHFDRSGREAFLLTTALQGTSAWDCLTHRPDEQLEIVAALARFLRAVHALPVADCPFDAGHERRLADARRRLEAGLVDTSDFDEVHAGWSARQVWSRMTGLLPLPFERVVTHGDFSLGNVFVADGRVTGCLDVGRAGVADPYQDLAILWHNLAEFGEAAQRTLFEGYGIAEPDERRLAFHLCLDEFF